MTSINIGTIRNCCLRMGQNTVIALAFSIQKTTSIIRLMLFSVEPYFRS
jgi:hypothetical protein